MRAPASLPQHEQNFTADRSLADTIRDFIGDGWRLTFRDRDAAQLVKPKRVGAGWVLFPLVYVLVWLATNEGQAYLEDNGTTIRRVVYEGGLPWLVNAVAVLLAAAQVLAIMVFFASAQY